MNTGMSLTIQADDNGALVLPPAVLGRVEPGARFSVEPHGNLFILRRERDDADRWWASTAPAQRVRWLDEWIRGLPASPALPPEATGRDSMYE
jgi:hypothetical protein